MKKLLAIVLALFMLTAVVLLASCGESTTPDSTTAAPAPGQSTEHEGYNAPDATTAGGNTPATQGGDTPATQEATPSGTTPTTPTEKTSGGTTPSPEGDGYSKPAGYLDVDFGGRTFNFVTTADQSDNEGRWETANEIAVESRTGGTIIDTAVYDRNAVMKRLYNCEIKATTGAMTLIENDVNSGTNEYDFGSAEYMWFGGNTSGYYINLYDLDLNFDLPGWNQSLIDEMTIKDKNGVDKLYLVDGDFNVIGYKGTWVLYCNLDLYNQNFSESIFDIVNRGEWTIDKMMEMVSAVAQDNGDQTWTPGDDIYGLMSSTYNPPALATSMGIRLIAVDPETHSLSTSVEQITGNNAVEAVSKACQLYALGGVYTGSYSTAREQLEAGKTLFMGEVLDVLERMKDNENLNVTVLPHPLFAAQENPDYKFYVNEKTSWFKISKNACGGDRDMIADFLNVFIYHSNKIVYPAFRQTFGSVYCQDERAMEMLDYIINGRHYDLGYYKGVMGQITTMITGGKNDLARAANKYKNTLQGYIDDLLDAMTKSE